MKAELNVMLLTSAQHWRGSGVSYSKLARGLSARGHHVDVVVASDAVAAEYGRLGISARKLSLEHTGMREVMSLHSVARASDTDLVIVDKPRDVRLAAWLRMLRPLHVVIRYNQVGKQKPARLVDRWTARRASAVLYQGEYIRAKAEAELPLLTELPRFVVANGYDADALAACAAPRNEWRAAHGIAPDEFVVISVGFAEAEKRFDEAIDAVRVLAERGVDARFVFCGDGPCRRSLEERSRASGIRSTWLGAQTPENTLSAIGAADVLVHPCPVEIFGNVLAEAMALSTPVVARRAGGNVEMLGDDGATATLIEDDSPDAFANALQVLHADAERGRTLAIAARARLVEIFPLSRMIDGYETMMREIIGGATSPA